MYKIIDKNAARLHRHLPQKAKIHGTAIRPRISVFRSNKQIYVQLVDDDAHKTLGEADSIRLGLSDGGNVEGAKKVGEAMAKICQDLKIESIVFDRSGYLYHGRVQAVAEALRANGLKF
jgi:large subunit ribosomal protein L18